MMSARDAPASYGAKAATDALILAFEDFYRALAQVSSESIMVYPGFPTHAGGQLELLPSIEPSFLQTVMKLIARGADVNSTVHVEDIDATLGPYSLLHVAICYADSALVKVLLAAGASTQLRDMLGRSALHYYAAGASKPREILELLLQAVMREDTCNVLNVTMHNGNTPLHLAVREYNLDAVEALVAAGADTSLCNKLQMNPFHFMPLAVTPAAPFVLALLQGVNAKEAVGTGDLQGLQPLHVATRLGFADVIEDLISTGADVNAATVDGATPLLQAAQRADLTCVQLLLECGASVDNERLLRAAAFQPGSAPVVKALLDAGAWHVGSLDVDALQKTMPAVFDMLFCQPYSVTLAAFEYVMTVETLVEEIADRSGFGLAVGKLIQDDFMPEACVRLRENAWTRRKAGLWAFRQVELEIEGL